MNELLPCPFCGCTDVVKKVRKTIIVECNGCNAFMLNYQDGVLRSVVDAWNTRATQPQAPQGWKLVPIDPTKEMVRAGWAAGKGGGFDMDGPDAIYNAMVSAAPTKTPEVLE